ncbi:MAG: hypothetical protein MJZ32_05950 [Bacteroidaceae bacterium]|nr:hypothetical protein [Bacteroidaceae bacterium]
MAISLSHRKLVALLALISMGTAIFGQVAPVNNVSSPEVASLGLYGNIPVSLSTGTPNISVPLHEFNIGKYSLSMDANYHLADVKPDNQGGTLGIGWSLAVGGYITRTVRGDADELCGTDGVAHGYYSNAYRQPAVLQSGYGHILENVYGNNYYELTPDEFSFNFCGYSGNFYYSPDGWKVASDDDIKVEFDEASGFLSFNDLRSPIGNENGYRIRGDNNRFFNRFTLITPDGTRYVFGGKNATEYSVDYYGREKSYLTATSWKLSEIHTLDNRVVRFYYDTTQLLYDIRYVPQFIRAVNIPEGYNGVYARCVEGYNAYSGHLVFPVALERIETENETATFTYEADGYYGCRIFEKALYNANRNPNESLDPYHSYILPYTDYFVFTGHQGAYWNDHDAYMALRSRFKRYHLNRIDISNGHRDSTSILMCYTSSGRPSSEESPIRKKLSSISTVFHSNAESSSYSYIFGYNAPYDYGSYNSGEMYARYDADDWGYANGNVVSLSTTPTFAAKFPNGTTTKAETLKSLTFPTGGKVTFEYELHNYSKKVTPNHSLTDSYGTAGGLRVSKQTMYDNGGQIQSIKEYRYVKNLTSGSSSGILSNEKHKTMTISFGNSSSSISAEFKSEGGYMMPTTNLNAPDVSYSTVYEINKDPQGNVVDYTRYDFSNFDADIYGNEHKDTTALYSSSNSTCYSPYTSNSLERGKLLAETVFSHTNDTVARTMHQYKLTNHAPLKTIYQQHLVIRATYSAIDGYVGWVTNTHLHRYLLAKDTECKYSGNQRLYTKETTYSYDSHKMLAKKTEKTSRSQDVVTDYRYTSGAPDSISFISKNILSLPYSETRRFQGNVWLSQNNYSFLNNSIPYISSNVSVTPSGVSTTNYQVTRVDDKGNPLEAVFPDNTYCTYLWSNNGQTLAAVIKNVSYQTLVESVNTNDLNASSISALIGVHNVWRNRLHPAQIDFYSYDTNMNLNAHVNPYGKTVFYTYDLQNRLQSTGLYQSRYLNMDVLPPIATLSEISPMSIGQPTNSLPDETVSLEDINNVPRVRKTYKYNYRH